eukprot:m.15749 g.15749  ORF g.15749 m.15749 type:complete len:68 (+) comp5478_c0_seq1:537-740(+)
MSAFNYSGAGNFPGESHFRFKMPVGSFLKLDGVVANSTQHALTATDDFRISLTLRRLPELEGDKPGE